MPIRSDEALANMLGRAFADYANRVSNGLTGPYKTLLSEDTVDVVFTVTKDGIARVKAKTEEKPMPEIEAPVIVEPVIVEDAVEEIAVIEAPPEQSELKPNPKPKRKHSRKKKENPVEISSSVSA